MSAPSLGSIYKRNAEALAVFDKSRLDAFFKSMHHPQKNNNKAKGNRFKFDDGQHTFTCELKKALCCAKKKDGTRCGRNVIFGIFCCHQHTASIYKIRINRSKIPVPGGMQGLFVCDPKAPAGAIVFKKGATICPYFGEVLSKKQLDDRFQPGKKNTSPYALEISKNRFVDSACFQSIGSKANSAKGSGGAFKNNAKFSNSSQYPFSSTLKAVRNIRNGEEILVSYGAGYKLEDKSATLPRRPIKTKRICTKK